MLLSEHIVSLFNFPQFCNWYINMIFYHMDENLLLYAGKLGYYISKLSKKVIIIYWRGRATIFEGRATIFSYFLIPSLGRASSFLQLVEKANIYFKDIFHHSSSLPLVNNHNFLTHIKIWGLFSWRASLALSKILLNWILNQFT